MRIIAMIIGMTLLGACGTGLVNVGVKIEASGAGTVKILRFEFDEGGQSVIKGTRPAESMRLKMDTHEAKFDAVDRLDIGGITFKTVQGADSMTVTATIPTGPTSAWYREYGFSRADLERIEKVAAKIRARQETEGAGNTSVRVGNDQSMPTSEVVIELNLPGLVRDTKLVGRELPAGWKLEKKAGKDDGQEKRSAELRIPLAAILDGTFDHVVWRTTCALPGAAPDGRR